MQRRYTAVEAAQALIDTLGDCNWDAVALAYGQRALAEGQEEDTAARAIYEHGKFTLKRSRWLAEQMRASSFLSLLQPRSKGSAENPITKMFPAAITERRFQDSLDQLAELRSSIGYEDERGSRSAVDFRLREHEFALPLNIKNAGTRFEQAKSLVGLESDDCIPIPAYKAHAAVEDTPNLLYVVSADYELVHRLDGALPPLFSPHERVVWELLNDFTGQGVRAAEDKFVYSMARTHWEKLQRVAQRNPFNVISARKAIRVLHTQPKRTPGIGLRKWGTSAASEINVHVSIDRDMTSWDEVQQRLLSGGLEDIIQAVNRKRQEWVYDPEI